MQEIAIYTKPQTLTVKEYKGQRVITFKDIDTLHQRPDGTARRNFNENRERFIEGEDFFTIQLTTDEIRTQFGAGKNAGRSLTVVTKMGYLMLVKSFTDDLAWHIQRQLVKSYFESHSTPQAGLSPAQMEQLISMLDSRLQALPLQAPPREIPAGEYDMNELRKKKLLTRPEAAFYVGLGKTTVDKIIRHPDCQALVRIGIGRGRVFVNRERLDAYLDSHKD